MAPYYLQQFQPGANQLGMVYSILDWINCKPSYQIYSNFWSHNQRPHAFTAIYHPFNQKVPFNENMDTTISTPSPIHITSKDEHSCDIISRKHSNRHYYRLSAVIFVVIKRNTRFLYLSHLCWLSIHHWQNRHWSNRSIFHTIRQRQ